MRVAREPNVTARASWVPVGLVILVVAYCVEIAFYPQIATWIHERMASRGWDGSGLRYFQFYRALPVGLLLAAVSVAGGQWLNRRRPGRSREIVLVLAALNVAALLWSVAAYADAAGG